MNRLLLQVLLSSILFTCLSAQADGVPALISVIGVSEKSVDPNLLSLNVEVWSKAASAKAAQGLAGHEAKRVRTVIEQFKIKKEDIQTLSYSLNPEYVYDAKSQQNKIVGYRAVQILRVVQRKVEEGGAFLDALSTDSKSASAGVNINSISWETDKEEALKIAGLGEAVRAARSKADELAKAAGVRIKGVYRITHGSAAEVNPMPRGFAKAMMAESAPSELSSGQVQVRVEVQVDFEIQ